MLCIPKIQATKLINSLKGGGLNKLKAMTSQERREFLSKQVGDDMAKKVNASFEKSLVTSRKNALINFAKQLTGTKESRKDIIQRVNSLKEKELLNDDVLEDYVSEFLGVKITPKEVEKIKDLSTKITKSEKELETGFKKVVSEGKITKEYKDILVNYAKDLKEIDDFLIKQSPNDWSGTLWNNLKASMLFNPASWNVNVVSNIVHGAITKIERRVENMRFRGYSSDLARDWKKTMLLVRKQTGYDMSRALSLDEMLEKKIIGEQMSIGKDNFFTKFVYNGALGTPDAWAGRMAFADSLDLNTASMVQGMGLKGREARKMAREIFLDATQVFPKTEEGKLARQIAVQDAQFATWTNEGVISSATLKLKAGLNKFAEDGMGLKGFKLGDMIEPFVKTPANIAAYGLDASGVGILRGVGKFASLTKNYKNLTQIQRRKLLGEALRDSMRTGFGVGGALMLASFIPKDNFVGAYDPNRWKYEQLRNSNSNSIKIGNKWYSLDYFGGLATPLIAVMYAKKYGEKNTAKMLGQFAIGVADQTSNIPFAGSIKDMALSYNQNINPNDPDSGQEAAELVYKIFNEQITSRVPGLAINIAKLFDTNERESKGFLETLQSRLPGLRNKLPEKQDMFGQTILTESGLNPNGTDKFVAMLTQILAGARVKTAKTTPYGDEIRRLKDVGKPVSITSWKYRLGERQAKLKEKLGDEEYRRVYREEYGKRMIDGINKQLESERYKKLKDEDKKKVIDNLDDKIIESIYKKYKIK